jgi:hypothetical protein
LEGRCTFVFDHTSRQESGSGDAGHTGDTKRARGMLGAREGTHSYEDPGDSLSCHKPSPPEAHERKSPSCYRRT